MNQGQSLDRPRQTAKRSGCPAAARKVVMASGLQVVLGEVEVSAAPLQLPEASPTPKMPLAGGCSHGPAIVVIAPTDTVPASPENGKWP